MKIVIIGLGTVGSTILKNLVSEGHTVTIIDENKEKIDELIERYDVFGIVGNGACLDIQREARIGGADLAIVLTGSDETNVFACLTAKKAGAKNTIARVRNPDYRKQIFAMKDDLGISMIVNPELETANEIFNRIDLPSVANMDYFAHGKVLLAEVTAEAGCMLVGETLISLGRKLNSKVLICAVQRGEEVLIPSGSFRIQEGDRIHFTADKHSLGAFLAEVNLEKSPFKHIMIVGGNRISYYLADRLSKKKYRVKLIESNYEVADELADQLPLVTVIHGNGTQYELLQQEGIEAMDAFVALTEIDEENMVSSMFASKMHVKKAITKIKSDDLYGMLGELGICNAVSPKDIVADLILSYIRAITNKRGSNVLTLYRLVNNQVEALEFAVRKRDSILNVPLKELRMKKNCLIGCIIRDNEVIIPDGNTCIMLGDNVVAVTTHKNFDDLTDIFE